MSKEFLAIKYLKSDVGIPYDENAEVDVVSACRKNYPVLRHMDVHTDVHLLVCGPMNYLLQLHRDPLTIVHVRKRNSVYTVLFVCI